MILTAQMQWKASAAHMMYHAFRFVRSCKQPANWQVDAPLPWEAALLAVLGISEALEPGCGWGWWPALSSMLLHNNQASAGHLSHGGMHADSTTVTLIIEAQEGL